MTPRTISLARAYPIRRGPDGRQLCRYCGGPVPRGRRSWCSQRCVDEAIVRRGDPSRVRRLLERRDHGVCAKCGCNTEALGATLRATRFTPDGYERWRQECERLVADGWPDPANRATPWDAHHRHAVIDGGGGCGLDGYETLCCRCHRAETAKQRRVPRPRRVLAAAPPADRNTMAFCCLCPPGNIASARQDRRETGAGLYATGSRRM